MLEKKKMVDGLYILHTNREYFRFMDGTISYESGPRLMKLPIHLVDRIQSTYEKLSSMI